MAENGGQGPGDLVVLERWLDKRQLAEHLSCSVRWINYRMADGMPHAMSAGKAKFRASEVERWLEAHGHLERRGDRGAS